MRTGERELFENTPVMRAILRLSVPTVMGQIILVIYNMADTFFIGQTGSEAKITAATVCMPAFMFLSAISNLFGVGGASVISRAMGGKNMKLVKSASAFACWGCFALTLCYSLFALGFSDLFVDLLGGKEAEAHRFAVSYLTITVGIGGLVTAMSTLFSHLIRSEGRSLQASLGIMMGGLLNIALDPLFMFVLLPRGQEIVGAAVATTLSNLASLIYFLLVLRKEKGKSQLSFVPGKHMLERTVVQSVLSTGLPACLMTLLENISYAVLDNLMAAYGMACQAGLGVAKKINMLAHCIVRGMSQGVLPLIGYNYAAGNYRRMRQSVLYSGAMSVAMALLCMGASLTFSRPLIALFIRSEGSRALEDGAAFLRILCLGGPFSACAYAIISFFQATGKGLRSFMLAILRKGLMDIPMMFVLDRFLPVYGIVYATPITDVVCSVAALALFINFLMKHQPDQEDRAWKATAQAD